MKRASLSRRSSLSTMTDPSTVWTFAIGRRRCLPSPRCDQRMPVPIEAANRLPDLLASGGHVDRTGRRKQRGVGRLPVRKHVAARLRGASSPTADERSFPRLTWYEIMMSITLASRVLPPPVVALPFDRAALDFQVAVVGRRPGDIDQKEIVKKDVCPGAERRRRPIDVAVSFVPELETEEHAFAIERPCAPG